MTKVAFSIIMPAFNAETTLIESVESVLSQTFTEFELIIVDDCSTDGTKRLVEHFASIDKRVRPLFLASNSGVSAARNAAISCSEGNYIAFLDADDIWLETKLARQFEAFNSGADVVYSDFVRFYEDGREKTVRSPDVVNFKKMLNGNCLGNLTAAYNAIKVGRIYQESIGHEDYLMWLQIFQKNVTAKRIPESLARYRVQSVSVSANKFKAIFWTWNIYRNKIGLGFFSSSYHFFRYVVGALLKRV